MQYLTTIYQGSTPTLYFVADERITDFDQLNVFLFGKRMIEKVANVDDDGNITVELTQHDIERLGNGIIQIQGQYIVSGSSIITVVRKILIGRALDYQEITPVGGGNTTPIDLIVDSAIVIKESSGSGENGATFTPIVREISANEIEISWTNDKGLINPNAVTLTAPKGDDGFTPYIGANGNWFIGDVDTLQPSRGESGDGSYDYKASDYVTDKSNATAGLQALFDAVAKSELEIPNVLIEAGNYTIDDRVTCLKSINLEASGVFINAENTPDEDDVSGFGALSFRPVKLETSLTSSVAIVENTFTLTVDDASEVKVGDIIAIHSKVLGSYIAWTEIEQAEWVIVDSIVGNTITTQQPILYSYTSGQFDLNIIHTIKVNINGLTAKFRDRGAEESWAGVTLTNCRDSLVSNVELNGSNYANLDFVCCYDSAVDNMKSDTKTLNISLNYCVSIIGSNKITVRHSSLKSTRHAVTTGMAARRRESINRYIVYHDNYIDSYEDQYAADFHQQTEFSTIRDNYILGGCINRGRNNLIAFNYITNRVKDNDTSTKTVLCEDLNGGGNNVYDTNKIYTDNIALFSIRFRSEPLVDAPETSSVFLKNIFIGKYSDSYTNPIAYVYSPYANAVINAVFRDNDFQISGSKARGILLRQNTKSLKWEGNKGNATITTDSLTNALASVDVSFSTFEDTIQDVFTLQSDTLCDVTVKKTIFKNTGKSIFSIGTGMRNLTIEGVDVTNPCLAERGVAFIDENNSDSLNKLILSNCNFNIAETIDNITILSRLNIFKEIYSYNNNFDVFKGCSMDSTTSIYSNSRIVQDTQPNISIPAEELSYSWDVRVGIGAQWFNPTSGTTSTYNGTEWVAISGGSSSPILPVLDTLPTGVAAGTEALFDTGMFIQVVSDGEKYLDSEGRTPTTLFTSTSIRESLSSGFGVYDRGKMIYDYDLNKPAIWGNGAWIDGIGQLLAPRYGTTEERPTNLRVQDFGFAYFDITLNIPIFWRNGYWVDATGATV